MVEFGNLLGPNVGQTVKGAMTTATTTPVATNGEHKQQQMVPAAAPQTTAIATANQLTPLERDFELLQRQAKAFSLSSLVPKHFQGIPNIPNCMIVLEMAHRMSASPLMVAQHLYVVHGKPSWSSQFIISAVNSTGKFSPLRFEMTGKEGGMDRTCIAWAKDVATGERLESPRVSMEMAKAEGWLTKEGSKWKTMPDLMLRYRAATFFGRLYAPELLMGLRPVDELEDIDTSRIRVQVNSVLDDMPATTADGEIIEEATYPDGDAKE